MSLRWRKNKSELQKMYLLESINNILVVLGGFVFFNVLKFYSFLKGIKGFWLVDLDRNTPRFRSIRIILFSYIFSIVKKCCFVLYYNSQFQMFLASFVQNKISVSRQVGIMWGSGLLLLLVTLWHHSHAQNLNPMLQVVTQTMLPPDNLHNPTQLNYGMAVTDVDGDGDLEVVVAG